tara:strand:- start:506 stop:988 length:483 start_codon:yes stop_codon:yes gene_type:complete
LADSFTDDVIVNVFDVASVGAELILLINAILVFWTGSRVLFVLFDLVCHCVGLCYVSRIVLLLLDVLLYVALTTAKFFGPRGCTGTRLTVLAWRNSIPGSNNPPGLPCLEMPVLVLQMCCILGRVIICSKTAGSYCVSEAGHSVRNDVWILLQLTILINV